MLPRAAGPSTRAQAGDGQGGGQQRKREGVSGHHRTRGGRAQAGRSWSTILRKREDCRDAFADMRSPGDLVEAAVGAATGAILGIRFATP